MLFMNDVVKQLTDNRLIVIFLTVVAAALFFWGNASTPPMAEDYAFAHIIVDYQTDGSRFQCSEELIQTWDDAKNNINIIRQVHNSRLGNVLYVLTSCGGGYLLAEILNTCVFLLFLYFFTKVWSGKYDCRSVLGSLAAVFIFLSVGQRAWLWHVASLAYMTGSMVLAVFFFCLERTIESKEQRRFIIPGAIAATFCAWLHEGCGLPLLGGLILFALLSVIRGKQLNYFALAIYLTAIVIPLVWLLTAPGVANRVSGTTSSGSLQFVRGCVVQFAQFLRLCAPIALATVVTFLHQLYYRRGVLDDYFICFVICYGGVMLLAHAGSWGGAFLFPSVVMTLYVMRYWKKTLSSHLPALYVGCALLAFIGSFCYIIRFYNLNETLRYIKSQQEQGHHTIELDSSRIRSSHDWIYAYSFPCVGHEDKMRRHAYLERYGMKDFCICFNPYVRDESLRKLPERYAPEEMVWIKTKTVSIVKLPSDYSLALGKNALTRGYSQKTEYEFQQDLFYLEFLWLLKKSGKKIIGAGYMLTANGNLCLVLDEDSSHLDSLNIELTRGTEKQEFILKPNQVVVVK